MFQRCRGLLYDPTYSLHFEIQTKKPVGGYATAITTCITTQLETPF